LSGGERHAGGAKEATARAIDLFRHVLLPMVNARGALRWVVPRRLSTDTSRSRFGLQCRHQLGGYEALAFAADLLKALYLSD
jgi:hypothetical protein